VLDAYCVPGPVLNSGDRSREQNRQFLTLWSLHFNEKKANIKQTELSLTGVKEF
jgi:hypothetical protein